MMYCHPHPELALRPLPSHRERYKKATLFDLDTPVELEYDIVPILISPWRGEVAEQSDAGEGERGKAGFALPGPLIYERVTNLKIP